MGGLFGVPGSGAQAIVPPVVTPPPVMPVPDDVKLQEKKRLAAASASAQRGRESTILSDDVGSDHLGG